ncbi:hypothetical protein Glove_276g101 [Diversispora epigaea]|uniref:Uncharacterized protein n=1 Tax=Diversispora epigaea TaxID=1348612 RepID=A0A397I347_9GLOM|nr:hypothetical protein Glove_276g101 [Diversispora epigaea]
MTISKSVNPNRMRDEDEDVIVPPQILSFRLAEKVEEEEFEGMFVIRNFLTIDQVIPSM